MGLAYDQKSQSLRDQIGSKSVFKTVALPTTFYISEWVRFVLIWDIRWGHVWSSHAHPRACAPACGLMSRGVCFLRVLCRAPFCRRNSALILAAAKGHAGVVKLLLADKRVDVNAKDNGGYFWARGAMAWRGHTRTHTRTCTRAHARTRFDDEGARKPGIRFIFYFYVFYFFV